MNWRIVPHTRESQVITLLLLITAPGIQLGWHGFLMACGLHDQNIWLKLLTFFPGGIVWFLAFYYAFHYRLLSDAQPRRDSRD